MAEDDVNYASVVFNKEKQPLPADEKREETVYDEVKVKNEQTQLQPDEKAGNKKCGRIQVIAACLGVICIFSVLGGILGFVFVKRGETERAHLQANQTALLATNQNLTQENHKLQSQNEHLRRDLDNLTVIIGNVTKASALLERTVTNLTAEKEQLSLKNQELQEKIETLGVVNVSMTQSIIDAYCPIPENGNERQCDVCAIGWLRSQSSCYAVNNAEPENRRSWEDAEKDCRAKGSHLAVIDNDTEKNFISEKSWNKLFYWIGLKVIDDQWKWLNGTSLSQPNWIGPPQNGQCATSFHVGNLRAAACTEKRAWICEKKALIL